MSTVIIIGGGQAHKAINELEIKSMNMDEDQRAQAEAMLANFTAAALDLANSVCGGVEPPAP